MTCSYHKTSKIGGKKTQIKKNMKKSKMTRKTKCVKSKRNQKKSRRNRKKRGGFDFSKGLTAAKNSMNRNALLTKKKMANMYKENAPLVNENMENMYNKGLSDINNSKSNMENMYKKNAPLMKTNMENMGKEITDAKKVFEGKKVPSLNQLSMARKLSKSGLFGRNNKNM